MLLKKFPDIRWLRRQVATNFSDQKGVGGTALGKRGWPTVCLNVSSTQTERKDICGPFSLFMNLNGTSMVTASSKTLEITSNNLAVTYPGESYDLLIPHEARTFNIHFGEEFFRDCLYEWSLSHEQLLDLPIAEQVDNSLVAGLRRTHFKTQAIHRQVSEFHRYYLHLPQQKLIDHDGKAEELLFNLSQLIFAELTADVGKVDAISACKKATRQEILSRLYRAVDYMHSTDHDTFDLQNIAEKAAISRFHFLRVFKMAFGVTPRQYWNNLRLQKSLTYLSEGLSVSTISRTLGFEHGNAFTKFFRQHTGITPTDYKTKN